MVSHCSHVGQYLFTCTVIHLLLRCNSVTVYQGWKFAHLISQQITRFLSKNERMSDSLKKMNDSLNCSFLVSDLSDLLTIAHFL